jgi:hypothetical protein
MVGFARAFSGTDSSGLTLADADEIGCHCLPLAGLLYVVAAS